MNRRAVVTWVLMIPVAILNGVVRQALVQPVTGELRAHQISVLTGSSAFLALVYAAFHQQAPAMSDRSLLRLGAGWVAATIVFEFIAGHFVFGNPWSRLFHDYNLRAGRLWTLVLGVIALSPLAVKRLATR